jgi:SAM-dependent methyltransferase
MRAESVLAGLADLLVLPYRMLTGRTLSLSDLRSWWRMRRDFAKRGEIVDLFRNHEYTFVLGQMARGSCDRWIDVGTGSGPFASHALTRFPNAKVTINDIDPKALDAAEKHFAGQGFDSSRFSVDPRNLATTPVGEGESETFDVCTLISAIEHFPGTDDVDFLNGLWPFMKMGGRVIVTVPAMAYYEENNPIHYSQGMFERRYDPRAIYGRLQPNGYRIEDLVYLHHGRTHLARALSKRYGNLNHFFGLWYKGLFPIRRLGGLVTLAASMLLVDRRPIPGDNVICAMLVLRKVDRRSVDALDALHRDPHFPLGKGAEVDNGTPVRLFAPNKRVRVARASHEGDFFVVPLFVFNYGSATLSSDSLSPSPVCLAVSLVDPDGSESNSDFARFQLDRPIPPGMGMFMPVNVPIARCQRYRLVFGVRREGGSHDDCVSETTEVDVAIE